MKIDEQGKQRLAIPLPHPALENNERALAWDCLGTSTAQEWIVDGAEQLIKPG